MNSIKLMAFLACAFVCSTSFANPAVLPESPWPRYRMLELGTLGTPPMSASFAWDINEIGNVVGVSISDPVRWTVEGGTSVTIDVLPTLAPDLSSIAYGINNAGLVVGVANSLPVLWDQQNSVVSLGDLPGGSTSGAAYDINNQNVAVGISSVAGGQRAFRWTSGSGMEDLGDLPGGANYSEAKSINDLGVIVGNSGGPGANEAFVWRESTGMVGLGTLPGDHESVALDVNDAGYVVGYSRRNFPGSITGALTAVVWTPDGSIFPVPNLGERSTWSVAINNAGWVVGQSFDAEGYARGTVWSAENGIVALEALVDDLDQDYRIFDAYGINDGGQIAAWAWSPYGVSAVLLTPVPEPATVLLLGCAASAIAWRRQPRPVYRARRCTA